MNRHRILLLSSILLLSGCLTGPPLDQNLADGSKFWGEKFEASPNNKYAVLLCSNLRDKNGLLIHDPYVRTDMDQIAKLLTHKGYSVWRMASFDDLFRCLENIKTVANKETKTFFAYSGKGDAKGLRLKGQFTSNEKNQLIIPPFATIHPQDLLRGLSWIPGKKALLINACEAGIFTHDANLNGVIIAACPLGRETTPYEPDGTSALYSTFLNYYADDIDAVHDLEELDITTVGGWWYNTLHKFFTKSSKGISYEAVIYRSGGFKL